MSSRKETRHKLKRKIMLSLLQHALHRHTTKFLHLVSVKRTMLPTTFRMRSFAINWLRNLTKMRNFGNQYLKPISTDSTGCFMRKNYHISCLSRGYTNRFVSTAASDNIPTRQNFDRISSKDCNKTNPEMKGYNSQNTECTHNDNSHNVNHVNRQENNHGQSGDDEINYVAKEIINTTSKNDVTILSLEKEAEMLIVYLLTLGYELGDICEFLLNSPDVIKVPLKKISKFMEALLLNGFNNDNVLDISSVLLPQNVSEEMILHKIEYLRSLGFRGQKLFDVIPNCPDIVFKTDNELHTRIEKLKEIFKTDDVYILSVRSNILLDDYSDIQSKFDYAYHIMGIRQRQMVTANLFNYSLKHLQNRHKFLERGGFYVTLKEKDMYKSSNPRLGDILSLLDAKFAGRFGDMTAKDYETFCKIMDVERDLVGLGEDTDTDDDSDGETGK